MIIFFTFVLLTGLTAWHSWPELRQKPLNDWILDTAGLWVQGLLIPLLQLTLLQWLYQQLLPNWHHRLAVAPVVAFILSFVAVDYLYYWNHRLLHSPWGWFAHRVHHTVTAMDVMGTSRNTLWSSFLIVYLWVHGLFIYLLADPTAYGFGVSLTAALDLWRHSRLSPLAPGTLPPWCFSWLVLPQDHGWHHQSNLPPCNYGANLQVWDRLHGTWHSSGQWPETLGQSSGLPLWRQLIYPHPRPASPGPQTASQGAAK